MDAANEKSLWLALTGAVLLIVGVFLPLVSAPAMGSFNYFRNGSGDGVVVLVLGVISISLAITGRFRGLWATGSGSLLLLGYTFFGFRKIMAETAPQDMKLLSPELQWGWGVLLAGTILVMTAASLHPLTVRQKNATALACVVLALLIGIGFFLMGQREPASMMSELSPPTLTTPATPAIAPPAAPPPEPVVDCSSYTPDMPSGVQIIAGMRDNVFAVHRDFRNSPAVISYLLTLKNMRRDGKLAPCALIPYTTPGGYMSGSIYLLDEYPFPGELRDFQNHDFTDLPILSSLYGSYRWDASGQDEAAVGFERNGRQYNGYRKLGP